MSCLSHKVCRLLSSPVLLRKFTSNKCEMTCFTCVEQAFFPQTFHVGVTPGETRLNKLPSIFFCWSNITLRDHVSRSLLCSDNVIILTFHLLPASVTKACKNSQTSGDFQVSIIDQSQGKMSCAVFYEPSETSSSSLWNQMSFSSVNILDGGWSCVEQYKLFPVWDVYDSRQTQDIVASNFWVGRTTKMDWSYVQERPSSPSKSKLSYSLGRRRKNESQSQLNGSEMRKTNLIFLPSSIL